MCQQKEEEEKSFDHGSKEIQLNSINYASSVVDTTSNPPVVRYINYLPFFFGGGR